MTAEEGSRMVSAACGKPNMVWFNFRRVPAIALAKQMIDDGAVGRVFHYRTVYLQQSGLENRPPSWKTDPVQAGSGVLGNLVSHMIDLALHLNGPIASVSAMQHTFIEGRQIEDTTLVHARFHNGSVGSFEATRFATGAINRKAFEIHGSKRMLAFNLEDMTDLDYWDSTEPKQRQGRRRIAVAEDHFWKPGHPIGYEHTFIAALGEFLIALADGVEFHPNFEDGQRVGEILDAIGKAASDGTWQAIGRI